ncbi:MAG: phytanoyl-CoA dioxygenase family protein [Alphaproteobacteria bacterium]
MDFAAFRSSFETQGFCVVPDLFDAAEVARMRAVCDDICASARGLAASDDTYDLERSHRPDAPRVRRIKRPHDARPYFRDLAGHDALMRYVVPTVGEDVRLNHSKINLKTAQYGAPLEWHQDWAFIPHTNQDLMIAAVMLDDCTPDNGPVLYLPGSHRGRLYPHHHEGRFYGAIDVAGEGLDLGAAVPALGRAGSVVFHHPLTVHGSALNRSAADRRLLFYEYAAADAWPLFYAPDYDEFDSRIVHGRSCFEPRMEPVYVCMPVRAATAGLIYALQEDFSKRYFETFDEGAEPSPPA